MTRTLPNAESRAWHITLSVCMAVALVMFPEIAQATTSIGGSMPWEGPFDRLSDSLQGPVARALGAAAIAGSGLAVAAGETGSILRRSGNIAVGGSIAFNAASWGLPFLGYTGAVTL